MSSRLASVELVEGSDRPAAAERQPPTWVRQHAWWVAGTVAAVVALLLGVQSSLDTRERARLEYLADVPGVLDPLQDPGVLWPWAPEVGTLVAGDAAGRWAVGARYEVGGVDLRGIDPATGEVRWSVPFSLDAALPPGGRSEFPSVRVGCTTVSAPAGPRTICAAEVSPVASGGTATPLVVLDPTVGTVLATSTVPPGSLWAATGRHLVVATPEPDDGGGVRWELTATDPVTGAVRWQRTTPVVPEMREVRVGDQSIRPTAALAGDDGRVLLTGSGHTWLFGADGEPGGDVSVARGGRAELARAGTLVWTPWQDVAAPAGVLVTRTGTRVGVGEMPAPLSVDDGTAPDVVLLSGGTGLEGGSTLVARDADTGDELWRADATAGDPLLVDGVVLVAEGTTVVARDARTGAVRWSAPVGSAPAYLGTDGSVVVVVTPDLTLQSLGLADGRPARTTDLAELVTERVAGGPGAVDHVVEYAGRLLVRFTDRSGIVLG